SSDLHKRLRYYRTAPSQLPQPAMASRLHTSMRNVLCMPNCKESHADDIKIAQPVSSRHKSALLVIYFQPVGSMSMQLAIWHMVLRGVINDFRRTMNSLWKTILDGLTYTDLAGKRQPRIYTVVTGLILLILLMAGGVAGLHRYALSRHAQ